MMRHPLPRLLQLRARRTLAVFAACALLFSQWVMASYACPLEQAAAAVVAAAGNADQDMDCCPHGDTANPGQCVQHCHPSPVSPEHAKLPTVPPLPAMALAFEPLPARALAGIDTRERPLPQPPPCSERYCRYLI